MNTVKSDYPNIPEIVFKIFCKLIRHFLETTFWLGKPQTDISGDYFPPVMRKLKKHLRTREAGQYSWLGQKTFWSRKLSQNVLQNLTQIKLAIKFIVIFAITKAAVQINCLLLKINIISIKGVYTYNIFLNIIFTSLSLCMLELVHVLRSILDES